MNVSQLKQSFSESSALVKWGSLIILFILIWAFLLNPLFAWKGKQEDALQKKIKKTAKIIALKNNASVWTQAKNKLTRLNQTAQNSFYHTATANQAQAKFQLLLEKIIDKNHMVLKNQRVTSPVPLKGVGDKLPVWLHLESNELSNIVKFLNDLANQNKIIIVEKFNIANFGRTKLLQMSVAAFRYQQPNLPLKEEKEMH
jgi:hypothetical protein